MSELNLAIYRAKAAREIPQPRPPVPVPIIDHSADIAALTVTVKELQAELQRLRDAHPTQLKAVKAAIFEEKPVKYPRLSQIVATVADRYGIEVCELLSQRRYAKFVTARHIAMYLCSKLTPASLSAIGRSFSDRDHTTVRHAVLKIRYQCECDDNLRSEIDDLKVSILSAV